MTARAKIGWVKLKECRELLKSKTFSLKIKGMVYWSCVRSAMLYGKETRCLRENGNFEKDQESNGESNVWCKMNGEKE